MAVTGNDVITVNDIITRTSQDLRTQLDATGTVSAGAQTALIDYTDRIHMMALRFSRWEFLRSNPQYFITYKGQTDYWLGPASAQPKNAVDTGLHLLDVGLIQRNSVRDISNARPLKVYTTGQPIGPNLTVQSGQTRPQQPAVFIQEAEFPNLIHIYPSPLNDNTWQPRPQTANCAATIGGSLPNRVYFVRLTFIDTLGGESRGSDISAKIFIPANNLLLVQAPSLFYNRTSTGVTYNQYNCYVGTAEGNETLQNSSPLAAGFGFMASGGVNFVEPMSGITTTGVAVPINDTTEQMTGYLIEFRYYKERIVLDSLDSELQIPRKYMDVVVAGVNYMGWRLLSKKDEAADALAEFKAGLTQMVWDKNLFPDSDFIRPDAATYVNQQILGYLPPFF